MKNIFEIVNEKEAGAFYKERELSLELKDELEKVSAEVDEVNQKISKGAVLFALAIQTLIYCPIILLLVLINGFTDDLTFMEELVNHKWVYIIGLCIELVCGLYYIYKVLKAKKITNSEEVIEKTKKSDEVYAKCIEELKIPSNHIDVDYLWEFEDNDHKKFDYYNQAMFTFVEDESLCLATLNEVYKIPLVEIKNILKTETKAKFFNWNKPTEPKNNKYNNCKVVVENGVLYKVKLCQINIENSFGNYFIAIPEYEYQVILDLINEPKE
jgi:hypothetical protein